MISPENTLHQLDERGWQGNFVSHYHHLSIINGPPSLSMLIQFLRVLLGTCMRMGKFSYLPQVLGHGRRVKPGNLRGLRASRPLVSIQGLLLVSYFWYEKFRGTSEGTLNSRPYNEKVYMLSRGSIRRALENHLACSRMRICGCIFRLRLSRALKPKTPWTRIRDKERVRVEVKVGDREDSRRY